jgi:hypothetical protein
MDEARRIAYNIAKLPAFLADLDPHQRTIRAPCTKIKGVAFVRFRRPSLNPKSWDNAAVKLFFQRSAYDGEGRQTDPSLKGAKLVTPILRRWSSQKIRPSKAAEVTSWSWVIELLLRRVRS